MLVLRRDARKDRLGVALRAVGIAALGSALIALTAQLAIPLPGSPVPVTGQTFGVLFVSATLGTRLGVGAVLLYLTEGSLGLPVWSPGSTLGVARLLGPTGGYLIGFLAAAVVVGQLVDRGWLRHAWTALLALAAGEVAIYLFGLPWLARTVGTERVLAAGLIPFLAGDLYKLVAAALAARGVRSVRERRRRSDITL